MYTIYINSSKTYVHATSLTNLIIFVFHFKFFIALLRLLQVCYCFVSLLSLLIQLSYQQKLFSYKLFQMNSISAFTNRKGNE